MQTLCTTPYFLMSSATNLLQNCDPPSLMMARGIPKRLKMFSLKFFTTILWSLFLVGMTSTHLDT